MFDTPTVPAYETWTKEMLIEEREMYYNLVQEAVAGRSRLTQQDIQNTAALNSALKRFK